ncbi:MAG TPA: hypothetical protein VMI33_16215 [Streptosporangiaceae bacterium]|nr:hypothetical protein [Streptosporangiaceae bacterium]
MTISPADLITNAALQWLTDQVNGALGSNVLTVSDTDGLSVSVAAGPGDPVVALDDFQTGPSGISGRLHIDDLGAANPLSADMFGDFTVALTAFDVTVAGGALAAVNIAGALTIPFFTGADGPETVDIDVSVRSDGNLAVTLSAQQSGGTTPDGLAALHYDLPAGAAIDLSLASLEVDRETSGIWKVTLTGSLALGTGDGTNWPSVDLRGLSIDSAGNISLDGGWIDLPSQTALDFFGFHVALQQLGFGTDAAGRWIGFTGEVQLVEGVPLGGSVRGLQINLDTGAVSFTGVSVDFSIPGVISFSGDIEHIHLGAGQDPTTQGLPAGFPTPVDIFAGGVDVTIDAAGGLEVDATFIVANILRSSFPPAVQASIAGSSVPCFFLTLDAELPAAIPLFVDIGLYGLSGLFATNLYPTVGSDTWWDWFKYPTSNGAPDTSQAPDYTATDPAKWLNPVPGAFALGAGATVGTQDDGFTASAAIAFMIIVPGPVIAIVGLANLLAKRIAGPSGQANFDALATYDGQTGVFDMMIDAHYSVPVVVDVQGTAELYASGTPPTGPAPMWFLALGKPPHSQRIQARVLDLFESDFYLVVSDTGLVTGIWVGYKNSWSFGPLSVDLDAYLAAQGAVQWSPFQIAAGIELHGEVRLDAFGITLGITADALLEATAPHPWWIYGSFQVELDLPWPLPNVGASVSLSWGGNDGSVPPAPLALNVVNGTLADHGASDRYELLAHRPGAAVNEASPGDTVSYDTAAAPGILAAQPPGYWASKYPTVSADPAQVRPDLRPATLTEPATLGQAALVPQDCHFTLTFAHPVGDGAGFANAMPVAPDQASVSTPGIVGPDDMSNINLNPPAVQWLIYHSLLEVALYQYDEVKQAWALVSATPQGGAPRPLPGTWVTSDPASNGAKPMTALRVCSYVAEPGPRLTAVWAGPPATLGTSFTDQGLAFSLGPGLAPAAVTASGLPGAPFGLCFTGSKGGHVTIGFPAAVRLATISGLQVEGGEFPPAALTVSSGGAPLPVISTTDDGGVYTITVDPGAPAVSSIEIWVGLEPAYLMGLSYQMPDVNLPILPAAPALYALKTVTQIQAGRPDSSGQASFQPVPDGDPVIEFAYFQCASGPGTAVYATPPAGPSGFPSPLPSQKPPEPSLALAAQTPATDFPNGGRLNDLSTYTQWSWPGDGDTTAYFGYDLNVEFDETYVINLYQALGTGAEQAAFATAGPGLASAPLHFRCVDRNNQHTLVVPTGVHVPSAPEQSALAGAVTVPALPAAVGAGEPAIYSAATLARAAAAVRAIGSGAAQLAVPAVPLAAAARSALGTAASAAGVGGGADGLPTALRLDPGLQTGVLQELAEAEAAAAVRAMWFQPLAPQTRYTLDIVGGPLIATGDRAGTGGLLAVFDQADAEGTQAALTAYFAREDALTTLQRVQFTTSRYATFAGQLANVAAQLAGTATAPVRRYAAAGGTAAAAWLASGSNDGGRPAALTAYQTARQDLAAVVGRFDSLYDETLARPLADPAQGNGEAALAAQRAATQSAWQAFAAATSASFDGLIGALGRPDLASNQKVAPPPDTELSVFTLDNDEVVTALLLESPEPLAWRRIWSWVALQPAVSGQPVTPVVLWSTDGTRALVVPPGELRGRYDLLLTFQGNIGAEVACITAAGSAVADAVTVGPLLLGPRLLRPPPPRRL